MTGKKYRIVSKIKFSLFITILILIAVFAFTTAMGFGDVSGSTVDEFEYRTVAAGETLWSIAADYNDGSEDIRQTVYEICEANDISAENLTIGQQLVIPL